MVTCSQYDFIEIACMFKLPVEITLKNGEKHQGSAFDTGYDMERQECLFWILKVNAFRFQPNS